MGVLMELAWIAAAWNLTAPAPPPPTVPPPAPLSVPVLLERAASRRGISPSWLQRLVWCESRNDPAARSPGDHRGLGQFSRATWQEQAPRYGYPAEFGYAYDAEMNADLMAALLAAGHSWRWSCK